MKPTELTYEKYIALQDKLDANIKEWYTSTYPTDECGRFLSANATFIGLFAELLKGHDVYDFLGEADSIIRERAFGKLSEILECDYDEIYHMWIRV